MKCSVERREKMETEKERGERGIGKNVGA